VASTAVDLLPGEADVAISRLKFTGSTAILADVVEVEKAFGVLVPIGVAVIAIPVGMRCANGQPPVSLAVT
jgi:hypothetical protein